MFPVGYSAGFRWQSNAIAALQEVAESYLINLFEYSNIVANNSKRVTVMLRDMQVVRRIRHFDDIVNRWNWKITASITYQTLIVAFKLCIYTFLS